MAKMATQLKAVPAFPKTIGATIDKLKQIRDEVRSLTKQANDLKKDQYDLEVHLMGLMDEQGLEKSSGKLATASLGESEITSVEDWDAFYRFIKRHNAFYLLERRPAQAANKEARENRRGQSPIPGTRVIPKRKINLRSL